MKIYPNFKFEQRLWRSGYQFVAGCDEVGRGSFAGPIVAACCGFRSDAVIPTEITIDDSKKLTHNVRKSASAWVKRNALFWGVGGATVTQINRMGPRKASDIAFRKSVINANKRLVTNAAVSGIDFLLIDAFYIPYVRGLPVGRKSPSTTLTSSRGLRPRVGRSSVQGRQLAIVRGDTRSISIAAASILAKVYRDGLMEGLSKRYKHKNYVWEKNKGYGTKKHRDAILKYGITRHHRKQYVRNYVEV